MIKNKKWTALNCQLCIRPQCVEVEIAQNRRVPRRRPCEEGNESANIILYDLLARERIISDLPSSANSKTLDVSKMEMGIYTYKIVIDNKVSFVGKILIE